GERWIALPLASLGRRWSLTEDYPAGSVLTAEMAAPPHKALTVPEVVRLIEEWKYRELHLRHQAVAASALETAELLETHRAERRILFDEKN
ncbi:hypothetical protein, partial [Salmonella sp. fj-h1]|uniref:hypothetical protein n=1 Tax=Salmonella sp. fj-h1 TaxID=2582603 RepID=UPI001F3E3802